MGFTEKNTTYFPDTFGNISRELLCVINNHSQILINKISQQQINFDMQIGVHWVTYRYTSNIYGNEIM